MPDKNMKTTYILIAYIAIAAANWIYVYYLKHTYVTVNSAWFLVTPMLGYVYCAFTLISTAFIVQKQKLGYALSCCVILLGMMAIVLSYAEVNLHELSHQLLLALLMAINVIILFLLGWRLTSTESGK